MSNPRFQKLGADQVERAYRRSFGDTPEGTIYWDPLRKIDLTPTFQAMNEPAVKLFDERMQAGDSFRAATEHVQKTLALADWTLPTSVLPELYHNVYTQTPVYAITPRIAWKDKDVKLDRLIALGAAKWKSEGAAPDEGEDTFEPGSWTQKFAMTKGKTTGPMQVFGSRVRNVVQTDQELKTIQMARLLETTIVNGDPSLNAGDGSVGDALAFQGLRKTVPAGHKIDPAGDDTVISRANIRAAKRKIWAKGGVANVAITDATTFDSFKATLEADYGVTVTNPNPNLQAFGFESYVFDGLTFVKTDAMPDVDGGRECLVADSRAFGLFTGLDVTMEPLAKTADADEYMMKYYGTLAFPADKWLASVVDLA